jgi:hypothetical protein
MNRAVPPQPSTSTTDEPIPQRWRWLITISTAGIVILALIIAIWLPGYTPVAVALAILGGHQVAFSILMQGARYGSNAPRPSDS